ncbi:MAG: hypothetical protein HFJ57_06900 [Clostridia bacterium]|nr:hypothetical protein [Clostridia bacterium]
MEKQVRVMTITSNGSRDFTILSSGLSGSVQYHQDQIAFLEEVLAHLKSDAEKRRKKDEEFHSGLD